MKAEYDETELSATADERIRTFQADTAREANVFHHLITLPTYHTTALSVDNLAKEYFGEQGMLGYVKKVQREEIRQGIAVLNIKTCLVLTWVMITKNTLLVKTHLKQAARKTRLTSLTNILTH